MQLISTRALVAGLLLSGCGPDLTVSAGASAVGQERPVTLEDRARTRPVVPEAAPRLHGLAPPTFARLDAASSSRAKLLRMENALSGRWIVVLHDDHDPRAVSSAAAEEHPMKVLFVYEAALRGFAAKMDSDVVEALRSHPAVRFIEEDSLVEAVAVQPNATWGLDRIDSRSGLDGEYAYDGDGTGVHAYVIDTGIRQGHGEFAGRIGNGYDSVGRDTNPEDCNGHGTHVAGTVGGSVYGVAKDVILHGVRVLSCSGSGSNAGVIAGVDWVAANAIQPAVANMSLGGGVSSALDAAVDGAVNANVVMAVAAGNSNRDACGASPARSASAITVGSTTDSDRRSSFSNFGACVDIFAPGSSITAAWYTSNTAVNTISGTSMASPHVAGVAALYREQDPSASAAAISNAILGNGTTGALAGVGSSSPNLLLFSLLGGGAPPPPPPPPPPSSAPCSGPACEDYSGTLVGTGDWEAQPSGTYFFASSGVHRGWLEGPAGTDFDLELRRWNGRGWSRVDRSISPTSSERVEYAGGAGYYYWRILSYSGSGNYRFWMTRP